MLSSRLHSKPTSLVWQIASRSLILLVILHFFNDAKAAAQKLKNTTIPITTPQIIYTPFVCNAPIDSDLAQLCSGAWQLSSSNDSISTTGPTSVTGNYLPQIFFEFQASSVIMIALPSSNASVTVTISSGGTEISNDFDSSLGTLTIVNLPQKRITYLTITFISSEEPTLFAVRSFIITAPDNVSLSSLLPTPSLPTTSVPISTSNSSSSPDSTSPRSSSRNTKIGIGVGVALALGLLLIIGAVCLYRCGKRRKERIEMDKQRSGWTEEPTGSLSRSLRNRVSDHVPLSVSGRNSGVIQ